MMPFTSLTTKISLVIGMISIFQGNSAMTEIIFEDNFNNFTTGWTPSQPGRGHAVTGGTTENPGRNEPHGWTGYIHYDTNSFLGIVANEGRNNSPALKIGPEPGDSPFDQIGLVKYLGEDGYDEIFIRFYIKYDQNWRWGDGTNGSVNYHKIIRIWQNVQDSEVIGNTGNLAGEFDRGHLLLESTDDAWSDFSPFFSVRGATNSHVDSVVSLQTSANVGGWTYNWAENSGFMENLAGNITETGYWSETQDWHSIEFHFKCASSFSAEDGIVELWFDGVKQNWPEHITPNHSGIPVIKYGTGINYIGLHDNGSGNQNWPGPRFLWIDDVVISTTYIGPEDSGNSPSIRFVKFADIGITE